MAKIEERLIDALPVTSATMCESGPEQTPYVWDMSKRAKQDPFFAVPSLVIDLPRMSLTAEDQTKVSITF